MRATHRGSLLARNYAVLFNFPIAFPRQRHNVGTDYFPGNLSFRSLSMVSARKLLLFPPVPIPRKYHLFTPNNNTVYRSVNYETYMYICIVSNITHTYIRSEMCCSFPTYVG